MASRKRRASPPSAPAPSQETPPAPPEPSAPTSLPSSAAPSAPASKTRRTRAVSPSIPYDGIYHRLFAHPVMVVELLRGYAPPELVEDLDLERWMKEPLAPLNSKLYSARGMLRVADVLQPIRLRDGVARPMQDRGGKEDRSAREKQKERPEAALLLLEFQSTPDVMMASRLMVYAGLAWQALVEPRTRAQRKAAVTLAFRCTPTHLPPVVPLVLYNGTAPWGEARDVLGAVGVLASGSLQKWQPQARCAIVEAHHDALAAHRGPVTLLFELERYRQTKTPQGPNDPHEVERLVALVSELDAQLRRLEGEAPAPGGAPDLSADELFERDTSLRGAFLLFILEVLRGRGYQVPLRAIQCLEGSLPMPTDLVNQVRSFDFQQGHQQGLQQGHQESRLEDAVAFIRARFQHEVTQAERVHLAARVAPLEDLTPLYLLADADALKSWLQPARNGKGTRGHR